MKAFINDTLFDEGLANLGVADLSIQRGFAIFDFFRTRNCKPLFLDDYLNRFYNSALLIGLEPRHTKQETKTIIYELIKINNSVEAGFKMILTGGYSDNGFEPSTPNFIILQQQLQMPNEQKFEIGLKIILHEYMRDLPKIKSTNYLMSIWLRDKIKEHNADDVLYYKNNLVLEFPRANVFAVTKKKVVITPKENVLSGVTRMKVLELASKVYNVEERDVSIDELKDAAELFMTSTTKRITPVVKLDNTVYNDGKPGEVTRHLYKMFTQLEEAAIR